MADLDETKDDEIIDDDQEEVETPGGEDENTEHEEKSEEEESQDQEQQEDESEEGDEPKPDDEDQPKFDKRFTQIKGDTLEEYNKNLEEAYRNSSTEAQRVVKELKDVKAENDKVAAVLAANPELAKMFDEALGDGKVAQKKEDPAIEYARSEMKKKLDGEYNEFVDLHPEMATDNDLREKVLNELSLLADAAAAGGRSIGMLEGLKKAWVSLDLEDEDSKETTITKAKEMAGKPGTSGKSKQTAKKSGFTDEQIEYAKKYGLKPEQVSQFGK